MISWEDVKSEFVWEGSWRDICVFDTQLGDWRHLLQALLPGCSFDVDLEVDGAVVELTSAMAQAFLFDGQARQLRVRASRVLLICHFFDEGEIEFDLDPREVVSQSELNGLLDFMRLIASATGKPALMTPENMHNAPFITVSAQGIPEYKSSDGFFEQLRGPA